MCHCVQTIRNLVRGRGKFNVNEEIILQFTVHDTSHHIGKQCEKTTKAVWTLQMAGIIRES